MNSLDFLPSYNYTLKRNLTPSRHYPQNQLGMHAHVESNATNADSGSKDHWIPYRENDEVKYMRAGSAEAKDFGSTGGTAKDRKPSAWGNLVTSGTTGAFGLQAPQLLQERYTDESVIPVIVTNVVPPEKPKLKE